MNIGVVVPNRNGAQFLRECLDSILEQDYPHVECILMDGASTDESLDIARDYEGRLRWFSQPDSCAAEAINRGWSMLSTPILAWLNSDDMWAPGAARRAIEVFTAHPEADVVSGECLVVDEQGEFLGLWPTGPFDLLRSVARADHILNQPAVFMKRSALERVGFLREMWLHDHDLWLRLGLSSTFVHTDDVLAIGRDRLANNGRQPEIAGPQRVKVMRDFLARDDLPSEMLALKNRAMSCAHLRATQAYLWRPRQPVKAVAHLARALIQDPSNPEVYKLFPRMFRDAIRKRVRTYIGLPKT